jgi:hypothetical protein
LLFEDAETSAEPVIPDPAPTQVAIHRVTA